MTKIRKVSKEKRNITTSKLIQGKTTKMHGNTPFHGFGNYIFSLTDSWTYGSPCFSLYPQGGLPSGWSVSVVSVCPFYSGCLHWFLLSAFKCDVIRRARHDEVRLLSVYERRHVLCTNGVASSHSNLYLPPSRYCSIPRMLLFPMLRNYIIMIDIVNYIV